MQLIGPFYSPYVRRVAISMTLMQLPFDHVNLSPFKGDKEMYAINPLLKVPALITQDKTYLTDSTLILEYLERLPNKKLSLMPSESKHFTQALHLIGVALVASEKAIQLIVENNMHEENQRSSQWLERTSKQVIDALKFLEEDLSHHSDQRYLFGGISQADITLEAVYGFIGKKFPELCQQANVKHLAGHCAWLEKQEPFISLTSETSLQSA